MSSTCLLESTVPKFEQLFGTSRFCVLQGSYAVALSCQSFVLVTVNCEGLEGEWLMNLFLTRVLIYERLGIQTHCRNRKLETINLGIVQFRPKIVLLEMRPGRHVQNFKNKITVYNYPNL